MNAARLVGDQDPRKHEFSVQLQAFDASKSGAKLGVATLLAFCSTMLSKSIKGGLVVIGELSLGGSIEQVFNAVTLTEIAIEKGALVMLMPVSCRRQMMDLSDEMATKIDIRFYSDAKDALLKALCE